jgi:putative phosphoribosyl transferase
MIRFVDRREAGRQLADRIATLRPPAEAPRGVESRPVVIGMARGGVPVAAEIAARLRTDLDVIVVRKIGCPWQPELGVGAMAEGGTTVLDDALIAELGIEADELDAVITRERRELSRRVARYRGTRPPFPVAGREVILVDDGLATGGTARAAIEAIRVRGASRVILAAPVAPAGTIDRMRAWADDVVVLLVPAWFVAIGEWYDDFRQTSDDDVIALLPSAPGSPEEPAPAGGPPPAEAPASADRPARIHRMP